MGVPSPSTLEMNVLVFFLVILPIVLVLYLLSQGIYYLLKKEIWGPRWLLG